MKYLLCEHDCEDETYAVLECKNYCSDEIMDSATDITKYNTGTQIDVFDYYIGSMKDNSNAFIHYPIHHILEKLKDIGGVHSDSDYEYIDVPDDKVLVFMQSLKEHQE